MEIKEEILETAPTEVKVELLLGIIEKAMTRLGLSWRDITKALVNDDCPICASRIRLCLNCKQTVSVGTRDCLHCGADLEMVEIEPSIR